MVSEIFYSLQGEGRWIGVPSIFIRTCGCALRCVWCDTKYAWFPQEEKLDIPEILARIAGYPGRHVVVTGGEPTMAKNLADLIHELKGLQKHVTLETNGNLFCREFEPDLVSISPKLRHSTPWGTEFEEDHDRNRLNLEAIAGWVRHCDYQLKFVVSGPEDLEEIGAIADRVGVAMDPERVILMPLGATAEELEKRGLWLAEECLKRGCRFSPRLQIQLFGNARGR